MHVRDHGHPADRPAGVRQRPDTSQVRERILHEALAEAGFTNPNLGVAKPATWVHLLGTVPLFSQLRKRDLRSIAGLGKLAHVSAGQFLVREGFNAEAFYVLLTGTATVHRGCASDIRLSRGDFFGELGLLDGKARTASVVAVTDVWAARLPRDSFLELLDRQPSIARGLLAAMAERLRRVEAERSR